MYQKKKKKPTQTNDNESNMVGIQGKQRETQTTFSLLPGNIEASQIFLLQIIYIKIQPVL